MERLEGRWLLSIGPCPVSLELGDGPGGPLEDPPLAADPSPGGQGWAIVEYETLPAMAWQQVVSGTVYDVFGDPMGEGVEICLVVNGQQAGSANTDAAAEYSLSVPGGLQAGDAVLVYINDDVDFRGNSVALASGQDTIGLEIHANTVVVRSQTDAPISNADLDKALGSFADQGDILFSVDGSRLYVAADLLVWQGTTFAPGGNVDIVGDWILDGSQYVCELDTTGTSWIWPTGSVYFNPGSSLALQVTGPLEAPGEDTRTIIAVGTDGLIDTFPNEPTPGEHLGFGAFYRSITYIGAPDTIIRVDVNLFQAVPGDTDGSAEVDGPDLAAVTLNWDPAGTRENDWPDGDFDLDGDVDPSDLAKLVMNWPRAGSLPLAEGAPAPLQPTPDPGTTAAESEPATEPDFSYSELAPVCGLDQPSRKDRRAAKPDPAAAAVDVLLATYWP